MTFVSVAVTIHRGSLPIDVAFDLAAGETIALVGPNGAGKTSILRAIAGHDPGATRLVVGGIDHATTPAAARPVSTVFQDGRLFPHLDATDNVAFPLRARGVQRREARRRATELLDVLELGGETASRRPANLSGGEAQRVALARAVVAEPALLLLDEPFAALDAETRPSARTTIARLLAGFGGAAILVTHDPADAVVLADRMVVIEAGRITQEGTMGEIVARPATSYAATLVGTNLLRGHATDGIVRVGSVEVRSADPVPDGAATVVIPPAAVVLSADPPTGSPRNRWPATVTTVESLGSRVRVGLDLGGGTALVAEITVAAAGELDLGPGVGCYAAVKATEVSVGPDAAALP